MTHNISNALIIIATTYFGLVYGFQWWMLLLYGLAVISWVSISWSDERGRLWKAKAHLAEQKAEIARLKARRLQREVDDWFREQNSKKKEDDDAIG